MAVIQTPGAQGGNDVKTDKQIKGLGLGAGLHCCNTLSLLVPCGPPSSEPVEANTNREGVEVNSPFWTGCYNNHTRKTETV